MTWRELRDAIERAGVRDDDTVEVFDRVMFDELVGVYRSLSPDCTDEPDIEDVAAWIDMLRSRFLTGGDRSCTAMGLDLSEIVLKGPVAFRDADKDTGAGDGIVRLYYTSTLLS